MKNKTSIVLYAPEIPGNTGSIGRTCVALNFNLILIKPLGFELTEKALRRAGLDYWKHVNLTVYENWDDFVQKEKVSGSELAFFENYGEKSFYECDYQSKQYLVFGNETKGLPVHINDQFSDHMYFLPMYSEHIRSLNLSNVVTAVCYQALR